MNDLKEKPLELKKQPNELRKEEQETKPQPSMDLVQTILIVAAFAIIVMLFFNWIYKAVSTKAESISKSIESVLPNTPEIKAAPNMLPYAPISESDLQEHALRGTYHDVKDLLVAKNISDPTYVDIQRFMVQNVGKPGAMLALPDTNSNYYLFIVISSRQTGALEIKVQDKKTYEEHQSYAMSPLVP